MIRPFTAADAPWLVRRHGELYAADEGFDDSFAPLVARILDAFLADHDPTCEAGWLAETEGRPLGSIFCVRADPEADREAKGEAGAPRTAKLRLFLLEPAARGQGLGRRLLQTCLDFARQAGYRDMTLWTHESHRAACALYARAGFTLTASRPVHNFGVDLVEQEWHLDLAAG